MLSINSKLLPVVHCSSFDSTVTLFWFSVSILFSFLLSLIILLDLSFCLSDLLTLTSTTGRLTRFLTADYHLVELGRFLLLVHF